MLEHPIPEKADECETAEQIEADYGREWRLSQRDEESLYGWEWCQTFHRLRDAKAAVENIKA